MSRQVVGGLRFPEGPTLLPDGRVAFVELYGGCISTWDPMTGQVAELANVGGVPNAVITGPNGSLLFTQSGGCVGPWRSPVQRIPSIQVVESDGKVRDFVTEVDGLRLRAPNDLVVGRDGRLYFTDPGEGYNPSSPSAEGRVFVVDSTGRGQLVAETGPSFPNGIAARSDGSIFWVESYTRTVKRYSEGVVSVFTSVPWKSVPDGLKIDVSGRLFITGCNSGGLDVITGDGSYERFIPCGSNPVNCVFAASTLYVADGGNDGLARGPVSDAGSLWALDVTTPGAEPFALS